MDKRVEIIYIVLNDVVFLKMFLYRSVYRDYSYIVRFLEIIKNDSLNSFLLIFNKVEIVINVFIIIVFNIRIFNFHKYYYGIAIIV